MGKTSSSQKKKKRSKKSSKVRSRKISKTSNRKSKSKKLHRKESISDSSDDDSRTSFSVSSYSSEDEYKSKRARSRTRKDVKSGKKRVKRRSSSPEDSHRSRKKKGSKKDSGSRGRKRTKKKKKARRDASVSSTNSFDSSESEYEREKEREGGNIDRYRWMDQPSLYDQRTENSNHLIEEKGTAENNPRRLRSVIIVIKQEREGSELNNEEEHKEEIVCDHDDYPSCRSNDSNDGGSKKEPDHDSSFDYEKKAEVEFEKEDPCSEAHDPSGDPNGEDLETVLRRRALENLKKFRGKGSSESVPLERTLAVKIDSVQDKPPDEDRGRADLACSLQSGENNSEGGEGADHNVVKSPSEAVISKKTQEEAVISKKTQEEAIISKEPQEEAKEASQYEQKTMSVMRGGEMVQVSYSVYIPKKTPALARRQLKR